MVDLKTATFERDNKIWAVGFVYVDGGFGDRVPEYVQRLLIAETLLKDAGFCGARIIAYPSWESPYQYGEEKLEPLNDLKLDNTMVYVVSSEREATPEEVAEHGAKKATSIISQINSHTRQMVACREFLDNATKELGELMGHPEVASRVDLDKVAALLESGNTLMDIWV